MDEILVAVIISAAVICDLGFKRIPNLLILLGYVLGGVFLVEDLGFGSLYLLIVRAGWPILVLYIFYYFGAVGAGDIKLFSCISVFLPFITCINIIVASFLIAAIYSFIYLCVKKNLYKRLGELREYVNMCLLTARFTAYKTSDQTSLVSFSVFIGIGFLLNMLLEVLI